MTKRASTRHIDRLHSLDPSDAAWRARQAHIDADIEGLHRDGDADRLAANMDASGVPLREQIARLKTYFRRRQAEHAFRDS